jgi:hypothetical protein
LRVGAGILPDPTRLPGRKPTHFAAGQSTT